MVAFRTAWGFFQSHHLNKEFSASGREAEVDLGPAFARHFIAWLDARAIQRVSKTKFEQLRHAFALEPAGGFDVGDQRLSPSGFAELSYDDLHVVSFISGEKVEHPIGGRHGHVPSDFVGVGRIHVR